MDVMADSLAKYWTDMAPRLNIRGIDIGDDPRVKEEEIANLKRKLAQYKAQARQAASRPSPEISPDSNSETVHILREFLQDMSPHCSIVDHDGLETLLSDARSWKQDLVSEKLFQFGNIEEVRGLGKPHVQTSALQLAVIIASGWFSTTRQIKLADINQIASLVNTETPVLVYALMAALFMRMVKDVPDQLSLEEQLPVPKALILLRLVQFLVHHIRRAQPSAAIWAAFHRLESHLGDAAQDVLVTALCNTLEIISNRGTTTVAGELRKTTPKFTAREYDFVLGDRANLYIIGADNSITFVPSSEYQLEIVSELEPPSWTILVDSPVLGSLSFAVCEVHAPGTIRSINQVFSPQLKVQYSIHRVDPATQRDICWE